MYKFFAFLLALVFVTSCAPKTGTAVSAQTPAPAPAPTLAPGPTDTTLLWKLSDPQAGTTSYLFGTIHLIPEEDYFMPAKVTEAMAAADEVIFEIDPREMQDPMQMMGLMGKIQMRGDTSLEDLLSADEYQTVENYFTETGMPFFIFKKMKPLFLSAMVGQDLEGMTGGGGGLPGMGGLQGMKSYEMELTSLAERDKQEISGLETMEFQLGLFDSIPYRGQAQMLYEAVVADGTKSVDGTPNEMDRMVDMYRRQAVAEMANMMKEETANTSRFEELLLTKRNQNWVPVIRTDLIAGGKFYAVGAGHLGGDNGVIALLRREGVTVEPVY